MLLSSRSRDFLALRKFWKGPKGSTPALVLTQNQSSFVLIRMRSGSLSILRLSLGLHVDTRIQVSMPHWRCIQKLTVGRSRRLKQKFTRRRWMSAIGGDPTTEYEAKFSIYHCIAAAISEGDVNLASFSESKRSQLADLRAIITASVAEPFKSAYPDHYWGAKVSVTLDDGTTLSESRQACKGDPEAPLTEVEFIAKAKMLMEYGGIEPSDVDSLVKAILDLPAGRCRRLADATTGVPRNVSPLTARFNDLTPLSLSTPSESLGKTSSSVAPRSVPSGRVRCAVEHGCSRGASLRLPGGLR